MIRESVCARFTNVSRYAIASAKHVAHIPEGVPLDEVSPVLCAGITVYKGLKESGARPGQTVAIVGAGGGLGSLAQQYAKAMGLRTIAIDSGEEKKALSEKMGCDVRQTDPCSSKADIHIGIH